MAVSECESVGESLEEGAGQAARDDRIIVSVSSRSRELIEELNRHLKGWGNYFDFGYPRVAFGEINTYVRASSHASSETAQPTALPSAGRASATTSISSDLDWCACEAGSRATACACLRTIRFQESRMREIRLSGSTRGEWAAPFPDVALSPTLPSLRAPIYRYASASLQYWKHFFTSVTGSALPRYSYSMNALIGHCLSRRS